MIVLFVLLSWIPRSCPVIRKVLIGCPTPHLATLTPAEQELARIPHQVITGTSATFEVKSDLERQRTRLLFTFQAPADDQITLYVENKGGRVPVTLVTHPLLVGLDWTRLASSQPTSSLYMRAGSTSITALAGLAALKADGGRIAADAAAARAYALTSGSYLPLEQLTSLDNVDGILTTYAPPLPDGTWWDVEREYDLSSIEPSENDTLLFSLERSNTMEAMRLGEVHVDYRK